MRYSLPWFFLKLYKLFFYPRINLLSLPAFQREVENLYKVARARFQANSHKTFFDDGFQLDLFILIVERLLPFVRMYGARTELFPDSCSMFYRFCVELFREYNGQKSCGTKNHFFCPKYKPSCFEEDRMRMKAYYYLGDREDVE